PGGGEAPPRGRGPPRVREVRAVAAGSPSSALLGRPEPRLFTPPARRLTRKTTLGYECAEFCRDVLGEPLLPWQDWLVKHALALDPAGPLRFRVMLVLGHAQTGSTA